MSTPKNIKGKPRGPKPKRQPEPGSLGDRIRKAREAVSMTTTQLGEKAGVSNVSITRIELGQNKPARRSLMLIAQALGNDFGLPWLRQYVQVPTSLTDTWIERYLDQTGSAIVPLLGTVAAGRPIEPVPEARAERITVPAGMVSAGKQAFALLVKGSSMLDSLIQTGDIVIIQRVSEPRNGAVVVAEIDDEVTLKTWKRKGNMVKLIPANTDYPTIDVPADKVKCVGEMIGLLRFVK